MKEKNMKRTTTLLCGSLFAVMAMGSAIAEPVTVKLTGTVSGIFRPYGPDLQGTIQMGQPATVFVTIDSDTPDQDPNPHHGSYAPVAAHIRITTGSWTFQSLPTSEFTGEVNLVPDNGPQSWYLVSHHNEPLPNGTNVSWITLSAHESAGGGLSSDALDPLVLGNPGFSYRRVIVEGGDQQNFEVTLKIESAELLPPQIEISPSAGFLLTQQNFDAALLLREGTQPASLQASVNGVPLGLDLSTTCQVVPPSTGVRPAILCPDAHAALASFTGYTKVDWQVTLTDGTVLSKSVNWDLIP
jgi:hypothetical protein